MYVHFSINLLKVKKVMEYKVTLRISSFIVKLPFVKSTSLVLLAPYPDNPSLAENLWFKFTYDLYF